mgnify:CR=1 FL=1
MIRYYIFCQKCAASLEINLFYEFISKNNLSSFQGCVVKYVCRYMHKNGIEDLDKIIHYCELEKKKIQDTKKNCENMTVSTQKIFQR